MSTTQCPDSHRCANGSLCVEDSLRESSFYCNCDVSNKKAFAGLSCEHEHTVFCNEEEEHSTTSFCTNGGECRFNVEEGEDHMGCNCEPGYAGSFCQYTEDQNIPETWPTLTASERSKITGGKYGGDGDGGSGGPNGVAVASGAIGAAVFLVGAIFMAKRRRQFAHSHAIEKTRTDGSNMDLDVDGAVLSDAMSPSSMGSLSATSPRSFARDDDDVEVDVI